MTEKIKGPTKEEKEKWCRDTYEDLHDYKRCIETYANVPNR